MQVLTYILLAIMLFFGAFGPGARTCSAVQELALPSNMSIKWSIQEWDYVRLRIGQFHLGYLLLL
jgi:hypothetical protein